MKLQKRVWDITLTFTDRATKDDNFLTARQIAQIIRRACRTFLGPVNNVVATDREIERHRIAELSHISSTGTPFVKPPYRSR